MGKKPASQKALYHPVEKTVFDRRDQTEKTVVMKKDTPEVAKFNPPPSGSSDSKP